MYKLSCSLLLCCVMMCIQRKMMHQMLPNDLIKFAAFRKSGKLLKVFQGLHGVFIHYPGVYWCGNRWMIIGKLRQHTLKKINIGAGASWLKHLPGIHKYFNWLRLANLYNGNFIYAHDRIPGSLINNAGNWQPVLSLKR